MKNLDPELRKFFLRSVSYTFAEIRNFVNYQDYNKGNIVAGLEEICALFGLHLSVDEKQKEVQQEDEVRKCINKGCFSIIRVDRWEQGIRVCADHVWKQKTTRKARKNAILQKTGNGNSKLQSKEDAGVREETKQDPRR